MPHGGSVLRSSTSQFFNPTQHPCVVIKVGTSSLIRADQGSLNLSSLASIVETARDLKLQGFNVIIVSSGAVGVGCQRLHLTTKPESLAQKQALAAVGQVHLMRYYDDLFSAVEMKCGQVLLTLDNLANRSQYVNAKNTFEELLRYGVVPIVNENDTVAVQELRFGDNDTLSAQVATLVQADWLFLLTDVPNLFTANPNTNPDAQPIYEVHNLGSLQVDTSTSGTQWGTGGMATKLTAARIATAAGTRMVICSADEPSNIPRIIAGERVGTVFHPTDAPLKGRKRWILSVPLRGAVWLDEGAQRAVQERKKSLFSAGILAVRGGFEAQDAVSLCDRNGDEFARALINYSHAEVEKGKGLSSRDFTAALGYSGQEEVCSRANICLLVTHNEDSDADPDGTHSPYDGPSRSATPPIGGSMPAAIAAAADAAVAAAEAAGLRSPGSMTPGGARSPLPPRAAVPAVGGGAVQQPSPEERQKAEQAELAARLAVLQSRGAALAGSSGQAKAASQPRVNWDAELAGAISFELKEEIASKAISAAAGLQPAAAAEDVNAQGWLPRQS